MSIKNKLITALTAPLLLAGCSSNGLINFPPINTTERISELISSAAKISRQRVKVSFYNRLSNSEMVPLIPEALESLSFNGQFSLNSSDFPDNKGLEQVFPFIEAGEHFIEIILNDPEQHVLIPLIVEKTEQTELHILVILAYDNTGKIVTDVQVGYDQNDDLSLDSNQNIYRSNNGLSYLIHYPDGKVASWGTPIDRDENEGLPASDEAPLPPGSEKENTLIKETPPEQNTGDATPPPIELPPLPVPIPLPLPVPGE